MQKQKRHNAMLIGEREHSEAYWLVQNTDVAK